MNFLDLAAQFRNLLKQGVRLTRILHRFPVLSMRLDN